MRTRKIRRAIQVGCSLNIQIFCRIVWNTRKSIRLLTSRSTIWTCLTTSTIQLHSQLSPITVTSYILLSITWAMAYNTAITPLLLDASTLVIKTTCLVRIFTVGRLILVVWIEFFSILRLAFVWRWMCKGFERKERCHTWRIRSVLSSQRQNYSNGPPVNWSDWQALNERVTFETTSKSHARRRWRKFERE